MRPFFFFFLVVDGRVRLADIEIKALSAENPELQIFFFLVSLA